MTQTFRAADTSVSLLLITSAGTRRYLQDLLDVIALPSGIESNFTYSRRRIAPGALDLLDQSVSPSGLLAYAANVAGTMRVIPLRYIHGIRLAENPAQVGELFPLRVYFTVGRFALDVDADYADRVVRKPVAADTELGPFVRPLREAIRVTPSTAGANNIEDWLRLIDRISSTPLNHHALFHVAGLQKRPSLLRRWARPIIPRTRSKFSLSADIGYSRYAFDSASLYSAEIFSALPKHSSEARIKVSSDTPAVIVSYPQMHTVAGVRPSQTVLFQVQRLQDTLDTAVNIEMQLTKGSISESSPSVYVMAQNRDEPDLFRLQYQTEMLSPKVTFGVRCYVSYVVIFASGVLILIGLFFTRMTDDSLSGAFKHLPSWTWARLASDHIKAVTPVVQAVGYTMVALSAYLGFRKIPG